MTMHIFGANIWYRWLEIYDLPEFHILYSRSSYLSILSQGKQCTCLWQTYISQV